MSTGDFDYSIHIKSYMDYGSYGVAGSEVEQKKKCSYCKGVIEKGVFVGSKFYCSTKCSLMDKFKESK